MMTSAQREARDYDARVQARLTMLAGAALASGIGEVLAEREVMLEDLALHPHALEGMEP